MADPDIIRLLLSTRWDDLPACLERHEAEVLRVDERTVVELEDAPAEPGWRSDRPGHRDVGILCRLVRAGGPALATHYATFLASGEATAQAHADDELEDLLTEALTSGLIVLDALDRPLVLDRIVALTDAVATLDRPSTQLLALVATARSSAFTLTGDVAHADVSIDAFRRVVAPPDGLGPLAGGGLVGARTALALVLAARDRAVAPPGSTHHDLLEAIAIARAAARLDPPLQPEDELAVNTLLTLLAELFQATGDVTVVDEALAIVAGLADRPPTVAQLAAQVLWLRLRHAGSRDPADLTRALHAVDEALTRAVTEDASDQDPTDLDELRATRRAILQALAEPAAPDNPTLPSDPAGPEREPPIAP
jgi:hypothetical protein